MYCFSELSFIDLTIFPSIHVSSTIIVPFEPFIILFFPTFFLKEELILILILLSKIHSKDASISTPVSPNSFLQLLIANFSYLILFWRDINDVENETG